MKALSAKEWAEQQKYLSGCSLGFAVVEPYQKSVVEALKSGDPLEVFVGAYTRRNVEINIAEILAKVREKS